MSTVRFVDVLWRVHSFKLDSFMLQSDVDWLRNHFAWCDMTTQTWFTTKCLAWLISFRLRMESVFFFSSLQHKRLLFIGVTISNQIIYLMLSINVVHCLLPDPKKKKKYEFFFFSQDSFTKIFKESSEEKLSKFCAWATKLFSSSTVKIQSFATHYVRHVAFAVVIIYFTDLWL